MATPPDTQTLPDCKTTQIQSIRGNYLRTQRGKKKRKRKKKRSCKTNKPNYHYKYLTVHKHTTGMGFVPARERNKKRPKQTYSWVNKCRWMHRFKRQGKSALRQFSIIMQSSDAIHFPRLPSFLSSLSFSLSISCLMQHKWIPDRGGKRERGGVIGRTGKREGWTI